MLDVRVVRDDDLGVHVLVLEGDFTLDDRPRVEVVRSQALENDYAGLVVDMSGLTYVDSAGLMVILATFGELRRAGRQMAVAAASRSYAEAKLREIGLLEVPGFAMFPTAEEAKHAIAGRRP